MSNERAVVGERLGAEVLRPGQVNLNSKELMTALADALQSDVVLQLTRFLCSPTFPQVLCQNRGFKFSLNVEVPPNIIETIAKKCGITLPPEPPR